MLDELCSNIDTYLVLVSMQFSFRELQYEFRFRISILPVKGFLHIFCWKTDFSVYFASKNKSCLAIGRFNNFQVQEKNRMFLLFMFVKPMLSKSCELSTHLNLNQCGRFNKLETVDVALSRKEISNERIVSN